MVGSAGLRGRWCAILAGGDGNRLLPLTRAIAGDDRPKQFCCVVGRETLLDQTRRRIGRSVRAANTLIVLTKAHERFFRDRIADWRPSIPLIQPNNRGTAAAVLYSVRALLERDPHGTVAFVPSDHYVGNPAALTACLDRAFAYAERRSDRVVLVGVAPAAPETAYGWIEPGAQLREGLFQVRRFREKPTADEAFRLFESGCLWNSFIMIGAIGAFSKLAWRAIPAMAAVFLAGGGVDGIYAALPSVNFSAQVLAACPDSLAVMRADDLDWTDLGEPARVFALAARAPGALLLPRAARRAAAGS